MTRNNLGALALALAGLFFFVGQLVVQAAWTTPFSWADNNISDLGMVTCRDWGSPPRYVCSPRHTLMNAVFVTNGLLLAVGAVTLFRRVARYLFLAAAAGSVVVGLFPADVGENPHVLGAALVFVLGNVGMITARSATPRWLPVLFAVVGLVAIVLYLTRHGLGIGVAGMERVVVFPLFSWFLIEGVIRLRAGAKSR